MSFQGVGIFCRVTSHVRGWGFVILQFYLLLRGHWHNTGRTSVATRKIGWLNILLKKIGVCGQKSMFLKTRSSSKFAHVFQSITGIVDIVFSSVLFLKIDIFTIDVLQLILLIFLSMFRVYHRCFCIFELFQSRSQTQPSRASLVPDYFCTKLRKRRLVAGIRQSSH